MGSPLGPCWGPHIAVVAVVVAVQLGLAAVADVAVRSNSIISQLDQPLHL